MACAALAALLAALYLRERQRPHAQPPARFEIRLPEGHFVDPHDRSIALSPDGKLLAYADVTWKRPYEEVQETPFMLRPLGSLEARLIAGTASAASVHAVFSKDGSQIAYSDLVDGKRVLRAVPVAGGAVRTVCECDARAGAVWAPDDTIIFGSFLGSLQRVPATGGRPVAVTTLDAEAAEVSHRLPALLPDGQTVIYTALRWLTAGMTRQKAQIFAERLGSHERHLLVEGGSDGRWAPPGVLLFAREEKLLAAALDTGALRLSGAPVPIVDGIRHSVWTSTGAHAGTRRST